MNSQVAIARIQEQDYVLSDQLLNSMNFFIKNNAISGTTHAIYHIKNPQIVSPYYFQTILCILKAQNYNIKTPPKVKSNNPQDVFASQPILPIFQTLSIEQLKKLYISAHYLQVKNLRQSIAAYLATFVYVSQDPNHFNKRRNTLNINKDISNEDIKEYTEKYTFMN